MSRENFRLLDWLRTSPQADTLRASALLAVLLLIFFWRPILTGESLLPNDLIYELDPVWQSHAPTGFTVPGNRLLSDLVYQVYPWQVELQRARAERRIPLWTPYVNNGQPLLANGQVSFWDPIWLIAHLFPFQSSFLVAALLKVWIGGLSTFLLARQLGIGRRGAVLAMIVFAFSGPMTVWLGYSLSSVIVWLPLLLYLSDRALTLRTTTLFLVIGLVLAFQFMGGHPETVFHVGLVWVAFCLARLTTLTGKHVSRLIWLLSRMALATVIGLALSAVQLLPTVHEILGSSILVQRQTGVSSALWQTILLSWHNWPTLVTTLLPQFFGTPIDNSYWYPYQNYSEQTFYAGVVPLALGLVTLSVWWSSRCRGNTVEAHSNSRMVAWLGFWIGLTLFALGMAAQLPLFNMFSTLPVLQLINQGRLRLVYVLGLALLAGYGLDALAANHLTRFQSSRRLLIALSALAIISLILIGSAYAGVTVLHDQFIRAGQQQAQAMKANDHPMFPYSLAYYYERVNARYIQTKNLYTLATPEMFLPVGMALAVGLLAWLRRRGGSQAFWLNGLVLLTCIDLISSGNRWNPTLKPTDNFPTTQAVSFLKQQPGLFRMGGLYLSFMPNSSMIFGLSDVRGYEPVRPWRQATLVNRIEGAFPLGHYTILRSADSRLLDLMNVEYMVTDRELGGRWALAFAEPDSPIRVYRNVAVLPRAFVVHDVEHAATPEAALKRLLDESFDFRTRVILEQAPLNLLATGSPRQAAQARVVTYEPERITVETDSRADGILVLTDTYTSDWRAQVDEQPADVYIADYAFRAVRIPAGRHRVEFFYSPTSFYIGAAISMTGLVICGLWVAAIIYRKVQCKSSTI